MVGHTWRFWRRPSHVASNPALFDDAAGRWVTFAELWERVDACAQSCRGAKQLAFVRCRNDIPTVIAYLGALEAGHAVALLDARLDDALRVDLEEAYRPDLIFESRDAFASSVMAEPAK